MMLAFIARILRALGLLHVDLSARAVSRVPAGREIRKGDLIIVESDGVRKWACLKCPGGCDAMIALSLNPNRHPHWKVVQDWLGRPTIEPSIHQMNACRCHFWVRRGNIDWCPGGGPPPPKA